MIKQLVLKKLVKDFGDVKIIAKKLFWIDKDKIESVRWAKITKKVNSYNKVEMFKFHVVSELIDRAQMQKLIFHYNGDIDKLFNKIAELRNVELVATVTESV